ncbi:MAG: CBS domain-containing protein [Desulfobulbaceae bacterium]|nr:CBS domain-containing protein [Desulfobulbaceae bacterium]
MLTVRQIMTEKIVTVEMDDKLLVVKEIFDNLKLHHLLVTENEILFGVLSDRDLLRALSPNLGQLSETIKDKETLHKRVHQIMTRKPITLRAEAPLNDAVNLLMTHNLSCIPIVDEHFKPVGIITWRDVMKALVAKR